jgi:hypothetical protein
VVGSPIPIGAHHAGNLVVGAGDLWVTSDYRVDGAAEDTVVVRIDPQTNRAVETVAVGGHPIDVAATKGGSGCRSPTPAGCCGSRGARGEGRWPDVRNPARPAVRFPFRAHICGLVPASNVYWPDSSHFVYVMFT